jgi:hypothetical protein
MLGTLVAMHVLAAAVSVGILTTLGQVYKGAKRTGVNHPGPRANAV